MMQIIDMENIKESWDDSEESKFNLICEFGQKLWFTIQLTVIENASSNTYIHLIIGKQLLAEVPSFFTFILFYIIANSI